MNVSERRAPRGVHHPAPLLLCPAALALSLLLCTAALAADGLLWFDRERPNEQARQAVGILAHAEAEGLNPANYGAGTLGRSVAAADQGGALDAAARAGLDKALTAAMRKYLSDLHYGQVDPRLISENYSPAAGAFDPAKTLASAVRSKRLIEAVAQAAPPFPLYAELRQALAQYRRLAADTAQTPLWKTKLPPLPDKKIELGQSYEGLPMLIQRLEALGDLPAESFISTQ